MNRPAFPIRVAGVAVVLVLLAVIMVVPAGALPSRHQDEPTPRDTATAAPTYTPSPTPTYTPSPTLTPSPTPEPYIEVDPNQAEAGRKVSATVRGFHWPPGGIVTLYWDAVDNDHRLTDAFQVNAQGTFQVGVTIRKAWATVGTHTIYARENSGILAQAAMILLPPPPSDTPTPETPTVTFTPSPTLRPVTPMVTITPLPPTKAPARTAAPTRTNTPVPGTATATRTPSVTPTPSNTPGPGTPSATPLTEAAQPTATPEDQISDTGGGWGTIFLWGFVLAGLLVVFRLLRVRSLRG